MSEEATLLESIRQHLERLQRPVVALLKPGLQSHVIDKELSHCAVVIPDVIRELYSWRNGTAKTCPKLSDMAFFPGYYFLSLDEAISDYLSSARDNPVWNRNWFPLFCSGGGDYYAISCKGTPSADGEIVNYFRDAAEYPVEYEGLVHMLRTLDASFAGGGIVLSEGTLDFDLTEHTRIAKKYNPSTPYWR